MQDKNELYFSLPIWIDKQVDLLENYSKKITSH